MELARAIYLSALPHRQGFYRQGGWKLSSPDASDWRSFLKENFTALDRRYALREARKAAELTGEERASMRVLTIWDADYPEQLASIFDPPPVLFLRGDELPAGGAVGRPDEQPDGWNACALVGTRDPAPIVNLAVDAYIRFTAQEAGVHSLQGAGAPIVSGFARGVDGRAHRAAMENGLPGVAVLGAGLRHAGPRANLELLQRARRLGVPFTLVSEFAPWVPGHARNFPRRNRIIAGLSRRVIIMQAPRGSGALITGRFALEEGRDVVVFDHELLQGRGFNEGGRDFLEAGAERLVVPGLEELILREPPDVMGGAGPSEEQLDFRARRSRGEFVWLGGEYYGKKTDS